MCIPIHDPSNALHRLPPQDQNAAQWAANAAAFRARYPERCVSDDDDDTTCPTCNGGASSEHRCYSCGSSGTTRSSYDEDRDREDEWRERYDRSQRDD